MTDEKRDYQFRVGPGEYTLRLPYPNRDEISIKVTDQAELVYDGAVDEAGEIERVKSCCREKRPSRQRPRNLPSSRLSSGLARRDWIRNRTGQLPKSKSRAVTLRVNGGSPRKPAPGEEWKYSTGINAWEHLKEVADPQTANPGEASVSVSFTMGKVPAAALDRLHHLPSLRTLTLTQVEMPEGGLSRLAKLPQLQALDLCCAKIGDAEIKQLEGLTQLKVLDVSCTPLTDAGLEHLKGLSGLLWLNVSQTKVTDAGLAQLQGMSQLQDLDLTMLDVTDGGLDHLQGLNRLRSLDLSDTRVTGEGLRHLKELQRLKLLRARSRMPDSRIFKGWTDCENWTSAKPRFPTPDLQICKSCPDSNY